MSLKSGVLRFASSVRQPPPHGHVWDALLQARTDTDVASVGKEHGYPELLIAGLPPQVAHGLLNDLAGRVYDQAQPFRHGQRISDLIAGYDTVIVDGPPRKDLLPRVASGGTVATACACSRSCGATPSVGSHGRTATTSIRTRSR